MNLPNHFIENTENYHDTDIGNWKISIVLVLLITILSLQICCILNCCFGCSSNKCCDKKS